MSTATLKYAPKEIPVGKDGKQYQDSGLELNFHLPNGKTHKVAWTPANNYTVEVPLKLDYVDDFKKVKPMYDNFPQTLLNLHPNELILVEVKESPLVESPLVVQPKQTKKEIKK